jgi:tRNA pseudouridine38-40 synthase
MKPKSNTSTMVGLRDLEGVDAVAVTTSPNSDVVRSIDDVAVAEALGQTVNLHIAVDDDLTYFPPVPQPKPVPGQQLVAPGFARYRLEVQYRGESFYGWTQSVRKAVQDSVPSQRCASEAFEEALAVAMDVDRVHLTPAAIPEIGCHCRKLTCHLDAPLSVTLQPRTIMQRTQAWLQKKGDEGAILNFARAKDDFQARHSSTQRIYVYRILNRIAPPTLEKGLHWHIDRYLDEEKMAEGAKLMIGTHNFGAFADRKLKRSLDSTENLNYFTRTVDDIRVVRQEDEIMVWFVAKNFLRRQILNMMGTLKLFGQGLWNEGELRRFMEKGFDGSFYSERDKPPTAPVCGLTLWEVNYPQIHAPSHAKPHDLTSGPLEMDVFR